MAKTLELIFDGDNGSVSISLKNPKDELTPVEIKTAMQQLIATNSFRMRNGRPISPNKARLVERTTEDIELV